MTSDAVEPVLIYPDELINQFRTQFLVRNILFNLKDLSKIKFRVMENPVIVMFWPR